jgi:sulfur carrier protein ThiS adenylyltransferase
MPIARLKSRSDKPHADLKREFFAGHDPEQLRIWSGAVVGIAGAGGLGSNIAISLYRAGIGKLIIVDFDTVSTTNLNRQQFYLEQVALPKVQALKANLERIHPFGNIDSHNAKVTPQNLSELFGACDILIEAFDLAEEKQMLLEAWTEAYPKRPIIGASGLAGVGSNALIKQERYGNIYICGDGISELKTGLSPVAPRVALVANMQANLCLELLLTI